MAKELHFVYQRMLAKLENEDAKVPYNIVLTPLWMMIVLRAHETADIGQMR